MKDKFFIDTNIFVYSFDESSKTKQKTAKQLIQSGLESGQGTISYQVIQEFLNVATKKFEHPLDSDDAKIFVSNTLRPLLRVHSSIELFSKGLEIQKRYRLGFYDSLIIAAAAMASCRVIYSEDFQDGFTIDKLKIVNPFLKAS